MCAIFLACDHEEVIRTFLVIGLFATLITLIVGVVVVARNKKANGSFESEIEQLLDAARRRASERDYDSNSGDR